MRKLGYALMGLASFAFAYLAVVLASGDPATGMYAHRQQRELRQELAYAAPVRIRPRQRPRGGGGSALAVLRIPRIGVDAVVVEGTDAEDLRRGPGHYSNTSMPGSGRVVAIAGHRTTYGAWFRHIDSLSKGDPIYVDYRGSTFRYTVTGFRIVDDHDWSIIRYRGYEKLVLSACHPLYSASHRWVVFARLTSVRRSAAPAA